MNAATCVQGAQSAQPHAMAAEQAIIGILLGNPLAYDSVATALKAEDFYAQQHRIVYAAICEMAAAGATPDIIGVQDRLAQNGRLDQAGGPAYLTKLVQSAPSGANLHSYIASVQEKSMRRKVIQVADEIKMSASSSKDVAQDTCVGIDTLFRIMQGDGKQNLPERISKLLPAVVQGIEDRADGKIICVSTGFARLDSALLGGFGRGDLVVIAGRPSMGKTSFAMQIAANAAISGHKVMVFSLEMSKRQIVERLLAQIGGIEFSKIISGRLTDTEYGLLADAMSKLYSVPLYIDDTGAMSVHDVAARTRAQARLDGLDMIVIDYLQIMSYQGRAMSRNEQLGEMSRHLKALAKELDVPLVLLSQLNRDVEKRQDKRPVMSDLRDSGAIEQDSDLVIMMYRDEYYNEDTDLKGVAEAIVRKNRNGKTCTVGLNFEANMVRFSDMDYDIRID